MRQLLPDKSIKPGSGNGAQKSNENYRGSGSDLRKKRSRTGASQCPAKAEEQTTIDIPFGKLLWRNGDRLAINRLNSQFFNQPDRNHGDQNSASYNPIHMKRLHAEHLLNPKPTDYF